LSARRLGERIILDFPVNVPQNAEGHQNLIKAVVGDNPTEDVQFSPTTRKLLIRLKDGTNRSVLESISPSESELLAASPIDGPVRGVIVTLRGTEGSSYDFFSRYFAPWNGVHEDPVCGSAHTVLAPYWGKVLGKKEMFAFQCSRRGGELWMTLRDDGRLDLAGNACLILSGRINIQ
jgi:predicted PhzF superfamily epimerase YddE/YHI9